MKFIAGFLIVALLAEGNFALFDTQAVVPDTLLNLGAPLNGQYQLLINGLNSLAASSNAFINLNVSSALTTTSNSSISIVNQILQFSGPLYDVLFSYSSSLPAFFSSLIQDVANYSNTMGPNVTNVLIQELFLIQISLNNLIQKAIVDVTTVNSNVIDVLNSIEFLLLTADVIVILLADKLTDAYADFMLSYALIVETIYGITNNTLLFLVPLVTDPNALANIDTIILKSITSLVLSSQLQTNTASNTNQGSLSSNTAGLLSVLLKESFAYMNTVRSVPTVFSYLNLTYQDAASNLSQVENALNQLSIPIGIYSGSQIFEILIAEL